MKQGFVGVCKWGCGRPVKKPALYWHKECFKEYALHTRLEQQKAFLIARDGQRCAMKGCGCVPMKWQASPVMHLTVQSIYIRSAAPDMIAWAATLWPRPEGRWMDMAPEERETGAQQDIDRVCALEVDHRVALWEVAHLPPDERRPYFGPVNLWLLCPTCHKAKTKREAAARAALRRFEAAQPALPL